MRKLLTPEEIKVYRETYKLTRSELGEMCYTTKQTIWNIEHGKKASNSLLLLITLVLDDYIRNEGRENIKKLIEEKDKEREALVAILEGL